MNLTDAQKSVITAQNAELLVSAAAGSGKTAVLIERIYTLVAEKNYQIDRMLIVTFTNAAASEMRNRLETRFYKEADQSDVMRRQANLVENAQISTLHSFCQKLVRKYFEIAGIDPLAALCSQTLRNQLLEQALNETLLQLYTQALEDEDLLSLTQKFSQREVENMLLLLYSFLMSLPHPFEWLKKHSQHTYSQEDLEQGMMAETLLTDCRILLDGARSIWQNALSLTENANCRDGYAAMVRQDGMMLEDLWQASSSLLSLIQKSSESAFGRMPSYKLTIPEEITIRDQLKQQRELYKKRFEELKKKLPVDPSQCIEDLQAMMPALRGLHTAVQMLHDHFSAIKAEHNVIDFSDLEHMTLAILSNPEIQEKVSKCFDAIFVDEYQDISEIQEACLNAIKPVRAAQSTKDHDRSVPFLSFYVGDVKQSIYRFRQADPTLFMKKQELFSTDVDAAHRKIMLSKNFRSREAVLSAVNRVFTHVMRKEVTEIEYDTDAMLYPGILSQSDPSTTLHVVNRKGKRTAQQVREEAGIIAVEIKKLVDTPMLDRDGIETGEKITYKDIAILLPVARGVSDVVEQILTEECIPVYTEEKKNGLDSTEIEQILCHLRLLDNWMDDLSLLAVLRGPFYAFDEEELANVRICKPELKASFFETLLAAAAVTPKNALSFRCSKVIEDLKQERFFQQSMPLDEYLWDYLSRSGLYSFYGAQPGGKLRKANLRMLCNQANDHVINRGGDLHSFLQLTGEAGSLREESSPAILSASENVVRIMTIHKSKGLEFPFVFLMGLGRDMASRGNAEPILMHAKLGVALRYINEKVRTKRLTLLGSAISLRGRMEEKAERARLLYVAMTRPKEQLIMIGSASATNLIPIDEKYVENINPLYGKAFAVWESKNLLEWILQTLQKYDNITVLDENGFSTDKLWKNPLQNEISSHSTFFPHKTSSWKVVFHNTADGISISASQDTEKFSKPLQQNDIREKRLHALLSSAMEPVMLEKKDQKILFASLPFYPTPLKIGVTALCRNMREAEIPAIQNVEEEESVTIKRLPLTFTKPAQLSTLPVLPTYLREEQPQHALLRGIATHKALSLIDLAPIKECYVEAPSTKSLSKDIHHAVAFALADLKKEELLSEDEINHIQIDSIVHFFTCPIGKRFLFSKKFYREWSFNLQMESISNSIIQGVIDLCFLENNAWTLVDFKTDRVSTPEELYPLYHQQLEIYKNALTVSTKYPVAESVLFSLSLGKGYTVEAE